MSGEDQPDGLNEAHFARVDEGPDSGFYTMPRMVAHIDDAARAALASYFAARLPPGGKILDLMSACVSHLPEDVAYGLVAGLGMNAYELRENPQLDAGLVQDINAVPTLPFADGAFDACAISVSVQYLTDPVAVFAEIARVLAPGGFCHVSYSNRMFPTKAVAIWRMLGDQDHARLIGHYFETSGAFDTPQLADISPAPGQSDPLWVVSAKRRDPA